MKEIVKLSQETTSLDTIVDDGNLTRLADLIRDDTLAEPFEQAFSTSLQLWGSYRYALAWPVKAL